MYLIIMILVVEFHCWPDSHCLSQQRTRHLRKRVVVHKLHLRLKRTSLDWN